MEDKVLIYSKIDQKTKERMFLISIAMLFIGACMIFPLIINDVFSILYGGILVMFIISCSLLFAGIVGLIIHWIFGNCELIVTEKNVKGKTLFGKEVVLPMYMVSAYSTSKFLSTIAVATSSGITKFALISNYREIGRILSQKINERQQNTQKEIKNSSVQSSTDELIKLKSLLDAGIITQEEFDAKKKQLLGL